MQYLSTRGATQLGHFSEVLLTGLCPDGGLAMPTAIPKVDRATLASWQTLSYPELAFAIMRLYIDDIAEEDLREIIHKTYSADVFHSEAITPLTALGESGLYLLELSNGPSLAFKDIAMQFLGHTFEYVLEKRHAQINILGATSGDTGSAAEYAMLGKRGINVFMLSPYGRMSPFQQAQMYGLNEPNIFNIAIKGVFDDCQDLVKAVNADAAFKSKYHIGAVNSINWARVLAQSVYYFKAYFALPLELGAPVDFAVPSGNFGDVFAGFLAKAMGLPIRQLVVASNENDVLDEFFKTGIYRVRKSAEVAKTSSPSMDIGKASNFERFIYLMTNANSEKIAAWWEAIAQGKALDIREDSAWQAIQKSGFTSGKSTHANRLATIKDIYTRFQRMIDPHTADGVFVGEQHQEKGVPMICLETAQPAKFDETVFAATGVHAPRPESTRGLEDRPRHCEVMDNDVTMLKSFIQNKLE